jgi:hypothetical protein
MRSSHVDSRKSLPWARLVFIVALTMLLSGWTCSAMFISCQGVGTQPQLASLLPDAIPSDEEAVSLTVDGRGFFRQSQIMWNGNALETIFMDSHRLQATITQQTFDSFGGSAGSSVQISVRSQGVDDSGCPIDGNSAAMVLTIN